MNDNPELDPSRPPSQIEQRFVTMVFAGNPAVRSLMPDEARVAARRLEAETRGVREIDRMMREEGLVAVRRRARGYTPFSRKRARPKTVVVIPYNSPRRDSNLVGSLGLSEDELASGVIVRLEDARVESITTLDLIQGELTRREFSRDEVLTEDLHALREELERGDEPPDVPIDTSTDIASDAFKGLLFDDDSTMIHGRQVQSAMFKDAPLVGRIAELQYRRLQGLTASPDVSCCCCCCCCWGSCSSCA
jgi:hypothetical protein